MKKVLKISLYVLGSIIILLLSTVIWLNTKYGKRFVKDKVVAFLEKKLKTEVKIGELGYGLPKYIVLKNVLIRDQANDTLLAVVNLHIDMDMLQLLHKKLKVEQILLEGVHAHVYRNSPDTNFNYTYIIDAFASKAPQTAKPKKDNGSSFTIDVHNVTLHDIHAHYDDYTGGTRFGVDLKSLDLDVKKLDLDKMDFRLRNVSVTGLQTVFLQDTSWLPAKPDTSTKKQPLLLVADNVDLGQIVFHYSNALNKFLFDINLGRLHTELKSFDLAKEIVDVNKFQLDTTQIKLVLGKQAKVPTKVQQIIDTLPQSSWRALSGSILLNNVEFVMDNENQPPAEQGMDYSHLNIQNITLNATNGIYTADTISGNIKHLALREHCGLILEELRTKFVYTAHGATLNNLYMQTPKTTLQHYATIQYPDIEAIQKHPERVQLKLSIDKSVVSMSDVLLFAPVLLKQDFFSKNRNAQVTLATEMTGHMNDIHLADFYMKGLTNTIIAFKGVVKGIPDANKISYDLDLAKVQSSAVDINPFIPKSAQTEVRIPDNFIITGHVAGTILDYNTDVVVKSSDGNAAIKGMLTMSGAKGKETYDLALNTQQLNLGHILRKDTLLGTVTANINVKGTGFDLKTMNSAISGAVESATVKGYAYKKVKIDGKIASAVADMNVKSDDPNARLSLVAQADMSGQYPGLKANINIDSIDLRALKLYSTELRAHGKINIDAPVLNPDYPRGKITWNEPIIAANGQRYLPDSLYVSAKSNPDSGQNIILRLDAINGSVTGKLPLTRIGDVIQDHLNSHYQFVSKDTSKKHFGDLSLKKKGDTTKSQPLPANYDLRLLVRVTDRPVLHALLPTLDDMDSIHVDATLNPHTISLNASMPYIMYGGSELDNGVVQVSGTDSAFTYKVSLDELQKSKIHLWTTNISGNLDQNSITTSVQTYDSSGNQRFALGVTLNKNGDTQTIQLGPNLLLNYQKWNVAQPNKFVLAPDGMYTQNLNITNGNQTISANSEQQIPNSPLKVDFNNFILGNLTQIISNDTALANGVLGGNITIEKTQPAPELLGSLNIQNLSLMNDTIGNVKIDVDNKQANAVNTNIHVDGMGNNISISGLYYTQTTNGNDLNFDIDLNPLAIKSVESLTFGQIRQSSGFLRGKLHANGTLPSPSIQGELQTDQLATTISTLNAYYKMPAEKLSFNGHIVTFDNFKIYDSVGNNATINGNVNTTDPSNVAFNLTAEAKKWRAIHSTAKDNKLFYGNLVLDADLKMKGTPSAPDIDGNITILKGTSMNAVTPDDNPAIQSTKGIVEFINVNDSARNKNILVEKKAKDSTKLAVAPGSNINVNISIDKDAEFSYFIDPAAGDFMRVRGEASLNTSISPDGHIGITGTYLLHEGAYQMNYNFIKRLFTIQDGSSITFAGDPLASQADITAIYQANVAPYDLVQRDVTDQTQLNYYKEKLPFNVELHVKGPIMQSNLTFNVALPDNTVFPISYDQVEIVQGKLNQLRADTSELNKQVFAVLILNHFVADDPFSSGEASSAQFIAKQSVSRFIGEQLNAFSNKLIKGVDFNVDLASSEDYTTGSLRDRTDLNLAASKRLLNDRLKLTIGNDFELEGPQTTNSGVNNYVPSNLAADYLLTSDGKYTVRAYRKNYDEGVLEGYVTETGLNFIVSLDYNKFKYVFKKKTAKPAATTAQPVNDIKTNTDSSSKTPSH